MKRPVAVALVAVALVGGVAAGLVGAALVGGGGTIAGRTASSGGQGPSAPSGAPGGAALSPTIGVTPSPSPTPAPTPTLVPDPLDGLPVTPEQAARHPIAVMVDDLAPARPQSGFSAASVVWQAPAEGGIPRYMMIFSENEPTAVGPVRSSRYYYIAWAAEWRAMYVHVGGSPQALATLAAQGDGQLVYDADQFRYGGTYLWRITTRFAPHNVYTDGKHLRELASVVGAKDSSASSPPAPVWQFAPDVPLADRPIGGRIEVDYPANVITYAYDRLTNTYLRSVTGETAQVDAANGKRVAPKNVVIMEMHFGPLNDGNPAKHRLEAQITGSGPAWIATNGHTVKGTWRKASLTAPTLLYGPDGQPVTLTQGQTFVQVIAYGYGFKIRDGTVPTSPAN